MKRYEALCRKLKYDFHNKKYITQALTHCSAGDINYERLEFLGDSILNFIISKALFKKFSELSEGELSRLRANLVKGSTLAEIAKEFGVGDALFLGQGELKTGGFRRASILADALEAIICAIYLDSGIEQCEEVVLRLYEQRLIDPSLKQNLKDAKTRLQEYLQAHQYSLPIYTLEKVTGVEHEQVFHVTCNVEELKLSASAKATTRRNAEQLTAKKILQQIKTSE